jgi:hypothetical protein
LDSIPEGVEKIGSRAYAGCKAIDELTLPKTITSIGFYSFGNCVGMESLVILPNSKTGFKVTVDERAFSGCTSLEKISLSGNVTSLGNGVFSGCTALEQMEIPEGVTSIGDQAFSGCTALESLMLPESLTSMGYRMIENTAVKSITIPKNVSSCGSYGINGPLANCKTLTMVVFEEGMTTIPAYVCASYDYTSYITTVTIPSTVTSIGNKAFYNCNNLTNIIYCGASEDDFNKISVGSDNTIITTDIVDYHTHSYAVSDTVAPTCTAVGYTLYKCEECGSSYKDDIVSALGHTEVKDLGKEATCTETGLTEGIHCSVCKDVIVKQSVVPAKGHDYVEKITKRPTCEEEGKATYTCSVCGDTYEDVVSAAGHDYSIEEVTTPATCENEGVKTIYCANCGESKEEVIPITDHDYVETVVAPGCTTMGNTTYTCSMCGDTYKNSFTAAVGHSWNEGEVTEEVTSTSTGVKTYTCTVCGETKTEVIPKKEDSVNDNNEQGNGSETDTGNSSEELGSGTETNTGNSSEELGSGTETNTGNSSEEQGSGSETDTGNSSSNKNNTANTDKTSSGGVNNSLNNKLDKGEMVYDNITKGTYKVTEQGDTVEYCNPNDSSATSVVVPDTVTVSGVTYEVSSISESAFKKNNQLQTITIGKNVTSIGKEMFSGCTKLKTVKFAAGSKCKVIENGAFSNCKSLTTVTLPNTITSIGAKAFYKNTALQKIVIPSKVKKIGKQAFSGCKKLKTIKIKTSQLTTKNVGANAFKGIHAKATVKVPSKKLKSYKTMLKKKGLTGKKQKVKK